MRIALDSLEEDVAVVVLQQTLDVGGMRGEPRSLGTKHPQEGDGDCISCSACVQTCPTGIDIRNGLQMECVHCTQCIDACDDVMTRVGKPTGLIRYSSQDAMAGKPRNLVRMRTGLYPTVLVIMLGGLLFALITKESADVTVLRGIGAPFTEEANGQIANQIRVKIANRGHADARYTVSISGLEDAGLRNRDISIVAPENPMTIAGGATRSTSMFILLPRRVFVNGERDITLTINDGRSAPQQVSWRLLGPVEGAK